MPAVRLHAHDLRHSHTTLLLADGAGEGHLREGDLSATSWASTHRLPSRRGRGT